MVPAGGWSAGSGGKRAALWCMGQFSPFVSAVVGREASGVGESLSGPSFGYVHIMSVVTGRSLLPSDIFSLLLR